MRTQAQARWEVSAQALAREAVTRLAERWTGGTVGRSPMPGDVQIIDVWWQKDHLKAEWSLNAAVSELEAQLQAAVREGGGAVSIVTLPVPTRRDPDEIGVATDERSGLSLRAMRGFYLDRDATVYRVSMGISGRSERAA